MHLAEINRRLNNLLKLQGRKPILDETLGGLESNEPIPLTRFERAQTALPLDKKEVKPVDEKSNIVNLRETYPDGSVTVTEVTEKLKTTKVIAINAPLEMHDALDAFIKRHTDMGIKSKRQLVEYFVREGLKSSKF